MSRPSEMQRRRSPLKFFGLVLALSLPFWLIGAISDRQLMPGLSVSALMAFSPMVAALMLVHRERGLAGVSELLNRSFDFRRIRSRAWIVLVLLLMPGVNVLVYGLMQWTGISVPVTQLAIGSSLLMLVAFFIGALGEELGWSGYILESLQER
jgi:membrane protease YdiL (CAAX protease family)